MILSGEYRWRGRTPLTRNPQTFQPLPMRLRPVFLERVKALPLGCIRFGYMAGPERVILEPRHVLLFMYHTGCHPEVLVHPRSSILRIDEGEHDQEIRFDRPKKDTDDPTSHIALSIAPDLQPFVREWIPKLKEREPHVLQPVKYRANGPLGKDTVEKTRVQDFCSKAVSYLVATLFNEIGLPGFTCRTLRHTFGNWVWLETHKVDEVSRALGVNREDALLYCQEAPEDYEFGRKLKVRAV